MDESTDASSPYTQMQQGLDALMKRKIKELGMTKAYHDCYI